MGRGRAAIARRSCQRRSSRPAGTARRSGFRAAHRLLKRSEPRAGQDIQPPEGDRDSHCPGRELAPRAPPDSH